MRDASGTQRRPARRAATATPSGARRADPRTLVRVVSVVMFVDTMLFAVIAPLLPGLAHELHLSKASAGLLTASYAIGMLVAALPCGVLAARVGPRPTMCAGLVLLAASTAAFGLLHDAVALNLARIAEGAAGACSWGGGLAWIADETPVDRRGAFIGYATAAAIAGSLFGPVIGTVAIATGRAPLFVGLAVVVLAVIVPVWRIPSTHRRSTQGLRSVLAACRRPAVIIAIWLMGLPAIGSGAINVLGPLRLHRLGAPAAAIGATFLIGAALATVIAAVAGRLSDRRGRLAPLRLGLASAAVVLVCFTVPADAGWLAVVIILASGALGLFWAPAMAMLSDAAEATGLEQGLAAALSNVAWAGGQVIGAGGGGAAAKHGGDGLPMAIIAGLCAATLLGLLATPRILGRRQARGRPPVTAG